MSVCDFSPVSTSAASSFVELALARLLEQPRLEVVWNLDRVDAEVALVVERDLRVPGGTGCLLVGGEERVLEGVERASSTRCPSPSRSA